MTFKDPASEQELAQSPAKLKEVVQEFVSISRRLGVEPVCTRVWGRIQGDSGVHAAKRAADFRDQTIDEKNESHNLYSVSHVQDIVAHMNACFPRDDGKLVCIHHSFQGMPYHFHLQIPYAWMSWGEIDGTEDHDCKQAAAPLS